jgi:hypothetical protein
MRIEQFGLQPARGSAVVVQHERSARVTGFEIRDGPVADPDTALSRHVDSSQCGPDAESGLAASKLQVLRSPSY